MLKPTLIIKNLNELHNAYLESRLDHNLVEIPIFNSQDTFLINFTGLPQIADGNVDRMLYILKKHSLPALKEDLFTLAKTSLTKQSGFILTNQHDDSPASKILDSFAILSPHNRKSTRGYILSLEDDEQNQALTKLINRITSVQHWVNHIDPTTFGALSAQALPALLLSNWNEVSKYSLESLMTCLTNIMEVIDKNVQMRAQKNPYLNAFNIDWLVFTSEHINTEVRRISSANRSLSLAIIRLGTEYKLWLPTHPPKGRRLQGRITLATCVLNAINHLHEGPSRSLLTTSWSRFTYISSGWDSNNIPIGLGTLFKQAYPKTWSQAGISKLIKYINSTTDINYPMDMTSSIRKDRTLKWFDKIKVYTNNLDEQVVSSTEKMRNLGFLSKPLPKEWYEFIKSYHEELNASDDYKRQSTITYLKWAIEIKRKSSPWDIKPTDLISPIISSKDTQDFQSYINAKGDAKNKKLSLWSTTAKMNLLICNRYALMGRKLTSPFAFLPQPRFSGRKRKSKTPRSRISQPVIDKMISIILDENKNGIPTYSWAENISQKALNTKSSGRSDHYYDPELKKYIFCPSRTALLSLLLLLPLRGVQGRWLDQGLSDDVIFDSESLKFIDNPSLIKSFKNEFGYTNKDIIGAPTGVIQRNNSSMGSSDDYLIYINSNKTKLWNSEESNGYHIPWPYVQFPKNDSEIRLNRPYTVIFEQLKWIRKYNPNPMPLRFDHLPSDAGRLTDAGNVKANTPFIAPLFQDLNAPISYKIGDEYINTFAPTSKVKLETLFNELCYETESQLRLEGHDIALTKKNANREIVSIFDIHSLRVAGISSLIERGVPVHIVSEFVAGHLSVMMTLRYFKSESEQIKEKIISANQNELSGMDKLVDSPSDTHIIQPVATTEEDLILNRNVASFAPVEGGVCPLGGKGCDGCQKGMMVERSSSSGDELIVEYQQVVGGCGNCRFWMTGPDFLGEQTLDLNRLMLQMRECAKEVVQLNNVVDDLEWEQDEEESMDKKRQIAIRLMNLKSTIAGTEQDLLPFMTAWSNKYVAIQESLAALEESRLSGDTQLTLLSSDVQATLKSASEFELVRTTIEQARLLPRSAVPIPESPARMLREFMDAVLANTGNNNLFASIADKQLATNGASRLANILAEQLNEQDIDSLISGRLNSVAPELVAFVSKTMQSVSSQLEIESKKNQLLRHKKITKTKQLQEG